MDKKPINILQVTGTMNRGGSEVMLIDIHRNISNDFRFNYLINYKLNDGVPIGDLDEEIVNLGSTIKHIGTQWDLGIFKYIYEFKKIYFDLNEPEIIHIHLNAKSGIIALSAWVCGIKKIIVHSHANLEFRGSYYKILLSKFEFFFQKFLIFIFASEYWGCSDEANKSLFYSNFFMKKKPLIIKNAINISSYLHVDQNEVNKIRSKLNIKKNTLVIGNVGRLVKHKNVDFIIDCLNIISRKKVDFIFIYAGRSSDLDYKKLLLEKITKFNLEEKVIYLGERDDIPTLLSIFDIFVSPALNEGFGLVAIEAQAAGLPCVLYKGFPEMVDLGLNLVTRMENLNSKDWADIILFEHNRTQSIDKEVIYGQIETMGYDIHKNVLKIENLYKND